MGGRGIRGQCPPVVHMRRPMIVRRLSERGVGCTPCIITPVLVVIATSNNDLSGKRYSGTPLLCENFQVVQLEIKSYSQSIQIIEQHPPALYT